MSRHRHAHKPIPHDSHMKQVRPSTLSAVSEVLPPTIFLLCQSRPFDQGTHDMHLRAAGSSRCVSRGCWEGTPCHGAPYACPPLVPPTPVPAPTWQLMCRRPACCGHEQLQPSATSTEGEDMPCSLHGHADTCARPCSASAATVQRQLCSSLLWSSR